MKFIMSARWFWCALVCGMSVCQQAVAADCYESAKIPQDKRINHSHTVLLLDETTVFDATQRKHIIERVMPLLREGSTLEVISFSAFSQGRYSTPGIKVHLAAPLDDATRMDTRKNIVKNFEVCLILGQRSALKALEAQMAEYFVKASSELARSDIIGVLKEVGDNVLPRITAREKRIVMISDMLENSDLSSFYAKGLPREIKPADEFARVKSKGMTTDLRHAKVWVIGAGVVPVTDKKVLQSYRTGALMAGLKTFWTQYFEESNAVLAGFGQPLLLALIDLREVTR